MDANTTPAPPSVPAPGIQAMSNYRTTFLDVDESAAWLPAVREAAGAMYPANASMARALAGDLSELIAITDPEAGTTISSLVSDRRISMLASHRRARGMSPNGVDRTISTLKALQRALCGVSAPVADQPKIVRERSQLDVLTQVADCDDPWLAQQASCLLQALEFGHWDRPLPHEDFRQFIKRARAAGFTGSGWRWRDMKTERLRRAFEQPTPVVEVMHRLNVSARQMSSIADALVPDGSDPSSVRGCGTLSRPSTTWRIVSNSTGTMQPSRGARTSPHRSSKAAARRLAEQIRHRNTADPVPLDPDLEQILATWVPDPSKLSPQRWQPARRLTHDIMRRSHIRGPESFRKHLRVMAAFIAWCLEVGYEEDVDAVMRGDVIDRYLQQALTGFPDSSRATIRADLRRVASKVGLSPEAPVTPLHVEKWDIKAPYAADEVRAILHRIDLVVDPRTRARLQTTVALGLGAGLDTRDIRELNRSHITDHGDDGIEIAVPGDRPRTVWLRSEFEAMLRTGIAKLTRNEHVLGRTNMHKDAVRDLLATIQPIGAGPRVQQGRLRNTWLATLMTEPVSLWIILQAAGLAGARSLTEIAAFLEPVTDTTVVRGAA